MSATTDYKPLASAKEHPITIYAMPGSQFSGKVICGLDSRNIEHYVAFVDADPKKRKLPSGGTLVPEMEYGTDVVPDSDQIFKFLDESLKTNFFPKGIPEVETLCTKASVMLNAYVLYYNWVHQPSYERSMRMTFIRYVPGWICCCQGWIVDQMVASTRKKMEAECVSTLSLSSEDLKDESKIHERLVKLLLEFQNSLHNEGQSYLVASTTQPTAADFALYVMLERLVGSMGDVEVPSALPALIEEVRLSRLWRWHQLMVRMHPIKFKGKRPPK